MMKLLKTLAILFAMTLSSLTFARTPEPVVQYPNVSVATSSGNALSSDQLCQTIRGVAEAKKWMVGVQANGKLIASYSWNGNKHTIAVEITCDPMSYSLIYRDSVNMKYGTRDGEATIHPHYNKFVRELNDSVRAKLMTM